MSALLFGVSILISLLIISIGIYDSIVVNNNYDAADKCWQIWANTLLNCINNVLFGIILFGLSFFIIKENAYFGTSLFIVFYLTLVNIWTIVINENIDENCENMYKDDFSDLWDAFIINVDMFYFYISFIGVTLIYFLFICCKPKPKPDSKTESLIINSHSDVVVNDFTGINKL